MKRFFPFRIMALPGLLLFLLAVGCGGPANDLAIHHANIIDMETGEVLQDRSLTVRDGIIHKLGPAGSTPAAADTLDAGGAFLMPGLWDMHVHFRGGDSLAASNRELLKLYLANGITSVRDAGGDITPHVLEWDSLVRAGSLEGPRIYTSGPKLDGPDARWDGSIELETPQQVPEALDSLQAIGADYVKIYDSTISPEVYTAILEHTEERGMKVSGHMPFSVDFRNAVRLGLDATEHMYYVYKAASSEANALTREYTARMNDEDPLGFYEVLERVMETYDPETAQRTFEIMAEEGTAVVATLYISEVLDHLHEADHSGDPYLDYIDPGIRQTYQGRLMGAQRRSEEAVAFQLAMNEDFGEMIRPMYEAGVSILAGSDAGPYNSFVYPGQSLHRELQRLVDNGLPPLAALQAATINGARWLEVDDRYGKVAPGYAADLLLLEGNPLEEISNTRAIAWVVQQGAVYSRSELGSLLESTRNE
ncbi:MAG: amidohydrolase family protein [Balneolaceae bacterium]|nr:amidohydrolase family protein [Balneolaceae bacterium]